MDLPILFLVCPLEFFAGICPFLEPIVVVPLHVGMDALVSLVVCFRQTHGVGDEGDVGVVVVVLVLEDTRLFVFVIVFPFI